ncbi:MAG: DUF5067 domain-containing protein, partial [Lachnospiraceae bacterium]|nr:DUF5067 domain-containing protein [Lachnospiraceae bacterium]
LIGVIFIFLHFYNKLKNKDFDDTKPAAKSQESTQQTTSGSVNVNNDKFALTCNKVQIVRDVDGKPVALIYFTFTNKLAEPLSMSDVFPPAVRQDDTDCETFATLENAPDELYDRDLQISDGQSIECCYAVGLQNTTDTITLTIHDNYETFTDIGSVDIPLSSQGAEPSDAQDAGETPSDTGEAPEDTEGASEDVPDGSPATAEGTEE